MRVLVTGSRDWGDEEFVRTILSVFFAGQPMSTLVYGSCPTGVDAMAEDWAKSVIELGFPVVLEPHPANWDKHGRRAGFVRNGEMVDLGADVCLAFIRNHSPGSTNCANQAAAAGIPTRIFREDADGNYLGEDK